MTYRWDEATSVKFIGSSIKLDLLFYTQVVEELSLKRTIDVYVSLC